MTVAGRVAETPLPVMLKVTVPVRVPLLEDGTTVAVSVIGVPTVTVVGEATIVVEVATRFTVMYPVSETVAGIVDPAVVPVPVRVTPTVPLACPTGITLKLRVWFPPFASVTEPPLQLRMEGESVEQVKFTVPLKPSSDAMVADSWTFVPALPGICPPIVLMLKEAAASVPEVRKLATSNEPRPVTSS